MNGSGVDAFPMAQAEEVMRFKPSPCLDQLRQVLDRKRVEVCVNDLGGLCAPAELKKGVVD